MSRSLSIKDRKLVNKETTVESGKWKVERKSSASGPLKAVKAISHRGTETRRKAMIRGIFLSFRVKTGNDRVSPLI